MLHLPSKTGYIVDSKMNIETLTYAQYLTEYGADETTTRNGVAPRFYVDGKSIYTHGVGGNNPELYMTYQNNREAQKALYEKMESYIEFKNWDAPTFFTTKRDLYEYLADSRERTVEVIKRYYRIQNTIEKINNARRVEEKKAFDAKKAVSTQGVVAFIEKNKEFVAREIAELKELKNQGRQHEWHVKADALVQRASGNDFRALKWKEIYNIIINS